MKKNFDLVQMVRKLNGSIDPAGDSSVDDKRFENLTECTELVYELIQDLLAVADEKDSYEHSVNKAGKFADSFLKDVVEDIHDAAGTTDRVSVLEDAIKKHMEDLPDDFKHSVSDTLHNQVIKGTL